MQNYDEFILRAQRIDPRAPYPVVHQAVRIALYDEYAARSFYARVAEAFGARPPFANIVRSEEQHIAVLLGLCERFGIPRPLDPFPQETNVEPTWLANCPKLQWVGVTGASAPGNMRARRSGSLRFASTWISAVSTTRVRLRSDRPRTDRARSPSDRNRSSSGRENHSDDTRPTREPRETSTL